MDINARNRILVLLLLLYLYVTVAYVLLSMSFVAQNPTYRHSRTAVVMYMTIISSYLYFVAQYLPDRARGGELNFRGILGGIFAGDLRGRIRERSHPPIVRVFNVDDYTDEKFFDYTRLRKTDFFALLGLVEPHLPPSKHPADARLG